MSQFCGSFAESSNRCGVTCAREEEAKKHEAREQRRPKAMQVRKKSCTRADFIGRLPASRRRGEKRRCPADPFRSRDRKSTRLNSSHLVISYAVFCLKKKKKKRVYHI